MILLRQMRSVLRVTQNQNVVTAVRQCFAAESEDKSGSQKTFDPSQSTEIKVRPKQEVPLHLRPYNKEKYEVPSQKIKYATGYALLDVEPLPRAKIMKLCYNILDKVKITPEECLFRIYTEEKIKYYMKLTDEIEDIRELESELGNDSIEVFIQGLYGELELIDHMADEKPWDYEPDEEEREDYILHKMKSDEVQHLKYTRPPREETKFIK